MTIKRLTGAVTLMLLLPACATVIRGTKEAYVIETEPPGADAVLSTGQRCTTPCSLKLKRKDPFTVDITRTGFEPVRATITSETRAGAIAGNIVLGGIIGAGVDASNGSLKSLVPNPLRVKLAEVPPPPPPAPASATSGKSVPVYTPTERPVPGAPPPIAPRPAPPPPPPVDRPPPK